MIAPEKQFESEQYYIITDDEIFTQENIHPYKTYVLATFNKDRMKHFRNMFLKIGRICQVVDPITHLGEGI